jgi:hypothetical protein
VDAAAAGECRTQRPAVLDQSLCIPHGAELIQEPRRALDIGEEEGDCAVRQVAHGDHDDRPLQIIRATI